jgi:lipopolysaccharide transport system permease protein
VWRAAAGSAASLFTLAVAQTTVTITPPSRWGGFGLRELWDARELLYFMTKRELQIRYKQSLFGVSWAVLQPLVYAFVFALFFGRLANVPSQGFPYPIFALSALVPWIFLSQGVAQASSSLVGDANLLGKVYFPRLVIPLAKVMSFLIDLVIALFVLGLFVALYGATPSVGLLALPGFLLLAFITALGAGILLATLNVRYRDVTVAIPLLIQLWLFATPVIYPGSLITGDWKYVYALNPMVSVIDGARWGLIGAPAPELATVAISIATAVALLVAGTVYFRRAEHFFADII